MSGFERKEIQLLSSPHYQRLATFQPPFDPLDVLGIPHRELSYSSVLRWLLSDPQNKEFQQEFLKKIAKKLKINLDPHLSHTILVQREHGDSEAGRTDLFAQVESRDLAIAIEVKVKSEEGHQQISRYQDFLRRKYASSENKIVVFITPFGRSPVSAAPDIPEVPVLAMFWKWIAARLNQCNGYGEMHDFRMQFAKHIRRSVLMHREERQIVIDLLRPPLVT